MTKKFIDDICATVGHDYPKNKVMFDCRRCGKSSDIFEGNWGCSQITKVMAARLKQKLDYEGIAKHRDDKTK